MYEPTLTQVGRLGRDPELQHSVREDNSATECLNISVASDTMRGTKWVRWVAFGDDANSAGISIKDILPMARTIHPALYKTPSRLFGAAIVVNGVV